MNAEMFQKDATARHDPVALSIVNGWNVSPDAWLPSNPRTQFHCLQAIASHLFALHHVHSQSPRGKTSFRRIKVLFLV
jgi:hypothetical protein